MSTMTGVSERPIKNGRKSKLGEPCAIHGTPRQLYGGSVRCPDCHKSHQQRQPHTITPLSLQPVGRPSKLGQLCPVHGIPRQQLRPGKTGCIECERERGRQRYASAKPIEPQPAPTASLRHAGTHHGLLGTHWLFVDDTTPGRGAIAYRQRGHEHVFVDAYPIAENAADGTVMRAGVDQIWARVLAWNDTNSNSNKKSRID